jgi:CheY-like chemotaxis protein
MSGQATTVRSRRGKILVVEDDAESMKLLATLLRAAGYEVTQANYPLQALFSVVRTPPDLILTDIRMPVMDGLEMIRQLKGHSETRHIPIVIVTACETQQMREAGFAAGCAGYLRKPIDTRALCEQVAEFL